MPIVSMNLNIIDRIKPELNVTEEAKYIFKGGLLFDYLRYPDRRFVRYGDSKRNSDQTAKNYQYALHIAERRGYTDIKEKAQMALHQAFKAQGGYRPNIKSDSPYDQYQHLQLFWGIDIPEQLDHYFRLYAGNNTVVVNGTSHGLDEGSWKGKANVWQNTVVNIAAEPKHLEDGLAEEFSFATQFLADTVNNATQERTLSTIRTSDTTGYYFDLFRSKSNDTNKFHDYIYHNIGDKTHIFDSDNQTLPLQKTDRYQNDIGEVVKSPGWRYFEDTKTTATTDNALKVRFDIEYDDRYMHLFVPEGVSRAYTKALAPPTREAKNGYVDKKTQVLAIRRVRFKLQIISSHKKRKTLYITIGN